MISGLVSFPPMPAIIRLLVARSTISVTSASYRELQRELFATIWPLFANNVRPHCVRDRLNQRNDHRVPELLVRLRIGNRYLPFA